MMQVEENKKVKFLDLLSLILSGERYSFLAVQEATTLQTKENIYLFVTKQLEKMLRVSEMIDLLNKVMSGSEIHQMYLQANFRQPILQKKIAWCDFHDILSWIFFKKW